jgi:hypothetical protein
MEMIDKANVLADYWLDYRNDPEWTDFMAYNDLGLPLAAGIADGFIYELTEAGESMVDETFVLLCKRLGIDEPGSDESVEDFLVRLP